MHTHAHTHTCTHTHPCTHTHTYTHTMNEARQDPANTYTDKQTYWMNRGKTPMCKFQPLYAYTCIHIYIFGGYIFGGWSKLQQVYSNNFTFLLAFLYHPREFPI